MNHMMSKTVLAGATALALVIPGIASAVTVSPGGPFTATGSTTLTGPNGQPLTCDVTLTGTVTQSGAVTVSMANFDPGDPGCALLGPANLPWTGSFDTDAMGLTLNSVTATAPALGLTCGPASVNPDYSNAPSTVTFNNTSLGACTVDGGLTVTPSQTVTP